MGLFLEFYGISIFLLLFSSTIMFIHLCLP